MGMDPLTLGLIGTGISTAGGIMDSRESNKNNTRMALARNAVLQEQNKKLQGFRDTNYGTFDKAMTGYAPAAQDAQLAAKTADRRAGTTGQINDATANVAAQGTGAAGSAPAVVGQDYTSRLGTEINRARSTADAHGAVSGYGDTWNQNDYANKDLGRNIDLTNNYARGTAALTGPLQDFAQFQANKAPSGIGTLLKGAGGLTSMYGQSGGKFGGLTTGGIFDGLFGGGNAPPAANIPLPRPRPAGL